MNDDALAASRRGWVNEADRRLGNRGAECDDVVVSAPRQQKLWLALVVFLSAAIGSLVAGVLILAGVEPSVGWSVGAFISVGTFVAAYLADRHAGGVDGRRARAAEAPRNARAILQSAVISVSLGALVGASLGQLGRGAVIGSILTPAVDAARMRIQANRR
jgi:hypothetical protein